jgi:PAS domain S-box-containing protein
MKDKQKNPKGMSGGADLLSGLFAQTEDVFRTIIQASPDGIAISDLQGKIIFATRNDFQMMGISDESEIIGTNVLDWIDPGEHEKAMKNMRGVFEGEKSRNNHYLLLKKNGEKYYGAINAAPLKDKCGRPIGMISIIRDISEIKKIEEDLHQKEYRYRLLFESAHDSIFLMDENVFVECNPKTLETFGCNKEDIIGKSPHLFSPPLQPDGSDSEHKAKEKIRAALNGVNQVFEWKHKKLNGTLFDAEVSLNALNLQGKTYLQAMVRNISKRKKADDQLLKFSECLLSFTENPDHNINQLTALCGEILNATCALYNHLNKNVLCSLGQWNVPEDYIKEDKPEGHICFDVINHNEQDIYIVNNLPETSYYQTDLNVKKYNLKTYMGKAVRLSGKPVGSLCAVFQHHYSPDAADKYLISLIASAIGVEEERRAERNRLMVSTEELKDLNKAKDKFFSIIAHDLKSPFNAILGFSEILASEWGDFSEEEKLHFIRNIHSSAKNTFKLLENLLEWSISQTGKLKFHPSAVDLSIMANEVVILMREQADRKQIKLFNAINFGTMVFADENMVRTIFRNLVSNAIKFSNPGGQVKIFSNEKQPTSETPRQIETGIQDNGIGIPEEIIPRLFRFEEQVRTTGTSHEKGTGLGLVLCKEFIEKNNGKIAVESELGKGSKFCFTLPAFLDL